MQKIISVFLCATIFATTAISAPIGRSSGKSSSSGMGHRNSQVSKSVRDGSYQQNRPTRNNDYGRAPTYGNNGSNNNYGNSNYGNRAPSQYGNAAPNQYGNAAPNYGNTGNYGGNYGQNRGYGGGAMLGAAAAGLVIGGVAGYMMNRDDKGNTYYTHPDQPGAKFDQNGNRLAETNKEIGNTLFPNAGKNNVNAANAGNVPATNGAASNSSSNNNAVNASNPPAMRSPDKPADSNSKLGILWIFILLALIIGGIAFFALRRGKVGLPTSKVSPEAQLEDEMENIFTQMQKKNKFSEIEFLRANTTPEFMELLEENIAQESETKTVRVNGLEAELVKFETRGTKLFGYVRYQADTEERDLGKVEEFSLDQVWSFEYKNGKWLWNGITEV